MRGTLMDRRKKYPSLQAWMEDHGINTSRLAKMAGISHQHMSNVLSQSRRCSWDLAIVLEGITNVSAKELYRWPKQDAATDEPASEVRAPHSLEQAS